MMILPEISDDITSCNLQLATSILPCDAYHHYYHYQSSAQYLWLAETLAALGREKDALVAYDKSLFQDHFNETALEGKRQVERGEWQGNKMAIYSIRYNKHPVYDAEFCISVGKAPDAASELHDKAVDAYLSACYSQVLSLIHAEGDHSNSRFLLGKCFFHLRKYEEAIGNFSEAIRLSHTHHDSYHRFASNQHLLRGKTLLAECNFDLAISDFTKALDLHSHNMEARKARAAAYYAKGNARLAKEDEACAM